MKRYRVKTKEEMELDSEIFYEGVPDGWLPEMTSLYGMEICLHEVSVDSEFTLISDSGLWFKSSQVVEL